MSNTGRPVIEWLKTIADPIVRESAIEQCQHQNIIVTSLNSAINHFVDSWANTIEGKGYWGRIWLDAFNNQLATIAPSQTDWMQEVHQMD